MSYTSDRDLLIRIDARTTELHEIIKGTESEPGLRARVQNVEKTVERAKGWGTGAAAVLGSIWGYVEYLLHRH